jgi:hypothetical protein
MELSWTEAGMTIVDALGRPCVEFDHAPVENGPHDLPRLAEKFFPAMWDISSPHIHTGKRWFVGSYYSWTHGRF